MCHPSYDTRHGEYRSVDLLRQSYHLIDETRVEVDVGTDRLLGVAMGLDTLDAFLLKQSQEFIFLLSALLSCQFACQSLQLLGTRVAQCVHSMTDAIYQTRPVVHLLVEYSVEISVNLVNRSPVMYLLLEVMNHVYHLDIGTTMKRTFQRTYAGSNARVSVGAR